MSIAASPGSSKVRDPAESRALHVAEVVLIFLVFFIQGAWQVPGVNEPHYLSKAKHYWDPAWCANDFLCASADAHQVFYWSFGWLTQMLPLPAVAWCGRLLTWALLAWSWRRLSVAIVPRPLYSVLSAALLVMFIDRCNMAGEWLIGGVEAKGFAYMVVFVGLEAIVRDRWRAAVLWFGAATALHPIVGGWAIVAAAVAWWAAPMRPPLKQMIAPLFGAALLALPGVLPALALTWGVDKDIVQQANEIYVYDRVYHHLLPQRFPLHWFLGHFALIALLVVLVYVVPADARVRRLRGFVAGAVGISAVGMVISLLVRWNSDAAASLLRYYWFRSSDVMVPVGVSLLFSALVASWQVSQRTWCAVALVVAIVAVSTHVGDVVLRRRDDPRPPADMGTADLASWREVCAWAAENTSPDAVFLTPRLAQTFRWYAGRAEVINRKDVPQDAAGIVEWWRRMNRIYRAPTGSASRWRNSLSDLGARQLRELGREFGADYIITSAEPPVALPRVGPRTSTYAIYSLNEPAGSTGFD